MAAEGSDSLLPYYLRELEYLHAAGSAFAREYPRVAEALDVANPDSRDPHVERLVESFAFLTARLQRTHDALFPEIPQALLDVLHPQLAAPVPSMSVAAFQVDPQQATSVIGRSVPAGTALFTTAESAVGPLTCRFRTGHPVTLWPIEVETVALEPRAQHRFLESRPTGQDVQAVLRVRLRCLGTRRFADMPGLGSLRFHLPPAAGGGTREALHELLLTQVRGVAVAPLAPSAGSAEPVLTGARLAAVGFAAEEALLPSAPFAHQAYRLLQEYFCFPDKFLFVDLAGLPAGALGAGSHADLLILLATPPRPGLQLNAASLMLGCTPIINLFTRITEPMRLDHTKLDYRLVADTRFESSTEIHSLSRVTRSRMQGGPADTLRPLFSFRHGAEAGAAGALYVARRAPAANPAHGGSDMMLSFVDPDLDPALPAADTVYAHALCTNRGLAEQVPPGAALHLELDLPLRGVACLLRPTPQVPPPSRGSTLWRLVSHLSANQLAVTAGADGLAALHEILLLYGGVEDATRLRRIAALTALASRRVVRHVGADAWRGFCRGLEVELEYDVRALAGGSAYLLGEVLSRFLGLTASVNSFIELAMRNRQTGEVWRWPARTGDAAFP